MIDINDFIISIGINLNKYDTGEFNGRQIRYLENSKSFEVGEKDFDRWANSADFSFDLGVKKGRRKLKRWVNNFDTSDRLPTLRKKRG